MSVIVDRMKMRGITLRYEGRWAKGPCPLCGGDDRFICIYPPAAAKEFFQCRQCRVQGDDIDFLHIVEGMTFAEAKRTAEQERSSAPEPAAPTLEDPDAWFDSGIDFVESCAEALLSSGRELTSLKKARGINSKTAERFRLGVNTRDAWVSRTKFGLAKKLREDGRECDLCLPGGIVIPVVVDEELRGIQIRRYKPYKDSRYNLVQGSALEPMIFEGADSDTVFVVESYLDGMLLWQELNGRITVIALGSASVMPSGETDTLLRRARLVLLALDSDEAGAAQSWYRWKSNYPKAVRCPIPKKHGTDPCEAWRAGLNLAHWANAGILYAQGSRQETTFDAPGTIRVGDKRAVLRVVCEPREAKAEVANIVANCMAIGVAINVSSRKSHVAHPHAGYHPRLSRVRHVAVYAEALKTVVVFDCAAVGRQPLAPLWKLPVVTHDGVELMRLFRRVRNSDVRVESTLLMANALTNEQLPPDVAVSRFTGLPNFVAAPDTPEGLGLCALALSPLYRSLKKALTRADTYGVYVVLREAQRAIAALDVNGVAFDTEAHKALCEEWGLTREKLGEVLPAEVNPKSHASVRNWLLETVPRERRRGWARTLSGELGTSDENLARVDDIPEVHALRELRRLDKLLSTYGARFASHLNPTTGRLGGKARLAGAGTGRLTCSAPNLVGLPRNTSFRALFHAPQGCLLAVADVSQFQLRIAAELTGDPAMLAAYAEGTDLHTTTAASLLDVDVAKITKENRRLAKAANFGLLFGQSAAGFRNYAASKYQLEMSEEQASDIRERWLERFGGIARWHKETEVALSRNRPVSTVAGRVAQERDLTGNALQQALAFQVQGSEAEVMLLALARLERVLRVHNALLVLFVHDEVLVEVPNDADVVAAVSTAIEEAITSAILECFPNASVGGLVEVHTGKSWAEAK